MITRQGSSAARRRGWGAASLLIAGAVSALAAPPPVAAQGLGVSPVSLDYADALRGGTYAQTLAIENDNVVNPARFALAAEGEIAPWVSFSRIEDPDTKFTEVIVPKDSTVQMNVTIEVPDDAANGDYEGFVEVAGTEITESEQGSGVSLSGLVSISVHVTGTQRAAGRVNDFIVDKAEVGMAQRFEAVVANLGNVQIEGRLDVVIRRGDEVLAELTSDSGYSILPERTDPIPLEWDTTDQLGGDYVAEYTVTDLAGGQERTLGTGEVEFRLEPLGSLTRSGVLENLEIVGDAPAPQVITQIEATFRNTGQIATTAVLAGELYRDDTLVETFTSLGRNTRAGEVVPIGVPVQLGDEGSYRFVAKINFDGFETESRTIEFDVGDPDDGGLPVWVLIAGGAALAAVLGVVVWRVARRRRRTAVAV